MKELIPVEIIGRKIFMIRGHKVMVDRDLAELYEVPTRRLNEQVKRNITRFPSDFMFQLSPEETENLRSQFATSGLGKYDTQFKVVFVAIRQLMPPNEKSKRKIGFHREGEKV